MRRVLVLGAHGQLGRRLVACGAQRSDLEVVGWGRGELDIRDEVDVRAGFAACLPDVVINAAAYTAVDAAEQDREAAWAINAEAPGVLARCAREVGASFVHISTDYVFDGTSERPYQVSDAPWPLGVYGASKWAGEQAVAAAWEMGSGAAGSEPAGSEPRHWIFRVAWLYDAEGRNFLRTMMAAARRGVSLRVVDDQRGTPTCAVVFASFLLDLAVAPERLPSGVWHYGHRGVTTWFGFAQAIFARLGWHPELAPCTTAEYPTAAQRPAYSHLDPEPLHAVWGAPALGWEEALERCLACMNDAEKQEMN